MGKTDRDLDASIDALLQRAGDVVGDHLDDDRAAAIVKAALAAGSGAATLDALMAPPELDSEPGEPGSTLETSRASAPGLGATSRNGSAMSDETPKPPSSRRPSLKDLAESVKNRPSQSDAPPSSRGAPYSLKDTLVALDGKTPPPPTASSDSARGPVSAPSSSAGGPVSASPASAPASSPAVSSHGPASAPSSARPLALAPMPPTSNPVSVPSTKPSAGVTKPAEKQGSNMGMGIGIVVIGLAAAAGFAFWSKSKAPDAQPVANVATEATGGEQAKAKGAEAAPEAKKDDAAKPEGVIDINQLADAAESAAPATGPLVGGPLPGGAPAGSAVAGKDPSKPAGPGEELDDAIRNRAGGGTADAEEAEPAAEGGRKNVPDLPATGAVTSAINAVKGNAKGCVAGAEEPSSATITFSSSGSVQSVAVGGWAQGKSAAACIKSALSSARVPPFAKPTYATSVTIRP